MSRCFSVGGWGGEFRKGQEAHWSLASGSHGLPDETELPLSRNDRTERKKFYGELANCVILIPESSSSWLRPYGFSAAARQGVSAGIPFGRVGVYIGNCRNWEEEW